jgi:hypothetical protein
LGENLSPGLATQLLAGIGILRNPHLSKYRNSCPAGIPANKIPVKVAENRNSCDPLQNYVPVKNPLENAGKKKSSGILSITVFSGIGNLGEHQLCSFLVKDISRTFGGLKVLLTNGQFNLRKEKPSQERPTMDRVSMDFGGENA